MRSIYKYPLDIEYGNGSAGWEPRNVIEMPKGAKILSAAIQHGKGVLWALVDPNAEKERRQVLITATGGNIGDEFDGRRFIGTLLFGEGAIVLHAWE